MKSLEISGYALMEATPSLKTQLTCTSAFEEEYQLYKELPGSPGYLMVPRALATSWQNDKRKDGDDIQISHSISPRTVEQKRVMDESLSLLRAGESFIVQSPTGSGKCHGKDTPIRMSDGTIKPVQDLVVGDMVMGPDSQPRVVLSTTIGHGRLFQVSVKDLPPFVTNFDHILPIHTSGGGRGSKRNGKLPVELKTVGELVKRMGNDGTAYYALVRGYDLPPKVLPGGTSAHTAGHIWYLFHYFRNIMPHSQSRPAWDSYPTELHCLEDLHDVYGQAMQLAFYAKIKDKLPQYLWAATEEPPREIMDNSFEVRAWFLAGVVDSTTRKASCAHYIRDLSASFGNGLRTIGYTLGVTFSYHVMEDSNPTYYMLRDKHGVVPSRFTSAMVYESSLGDRIGPRRSQLPIFITEIDPGTYYGFELSGDHLYLLESGVINHNTVVGAYVTAKLKKKTAIVVTKADIRDQWVKTFTDLTDVKADDIGLIQSDNCDVDGKKIVIVQLQSASKELRYPPEVFNSFGLVIFDEIHRLGADKFSNICWKFPAKLRLGLSATPDRRDGKARVFLSHIGPVEVVSTQNAMEPRIAIIKSGWRCPRVSAGRGGYQIPHKPGRTMHIEKMLAGNEDRNKLLVTCIKKAYLKGRKVLFFSTLKDHLTTIKDLCTANGLLEGDMALYIGGLSKGAREAALKAPIILATYAFCSEATDIPAVDTLIMGTPKSEVRQIVGRALRYQPDKKVPVIIDIQDSDSFVFDLYAKKRLRWYTSQKFPITFIKGATNGN